MSLLADVAGVTDMYFGVKSSAEHGTLYQLRNAINRTNVEKVPLDNFNACEDFFCLVINYHILSADMKMMNMESLKILPLASYVSGPENIWLLTKDERKTLLMIIITQL